MECFLIEIQVENSIGICRNGIKKDVLIYEKEFTFQYKCKSAKLFINFDATYTLCTFFYLYMSSGELIHALTLPVSRSHSLASCHSVHSFAPSLFLSLSSRTTASYVCVSMWPLFSTFRLFFHFDFDSISFSFFFI